MKFLSGNLLLADYVRVTAPSGKREILGVVNAIAAQDFPATILGMWFFWQAVVEIEDRGPFRMEVELRVKKPDGTYTNLLKAELEGAGVPPAGVIEMAQPLQPITFLSAGVRVFELVADGTVVASASLIVPAVPTPADLT